MEVNDAETNTTNNEESSASICFEAIKAEYDYCVTRAEKLENMQAPGGQVSMWSTLAFMWTWKIYFIHI